MPTLQLYAGNLKFDLGDSRKAEADAGHIELSGDIIEDGKNIPVIHVTVDTGADEELGVLHFQLQGYDDIDALRRFCEMTLDHLKLGVLAE